MPNFYQGSIRIKDLIPFLKASFEENGWNIVEEEAITASWFVMQKQASHGGIMTFLFYEKDYPNYGGLHISPALALDVTQDENDVYTSAYNPVTKELYNTPNVYRNYYSYKTINVETGSGLDNYSPYWNYFTTRYPDDEANHVYLFYKIHIQGDSFHLNIQGNQATSGNSRIIFYGGAFEKTSSLFATNDAIGLWGYAQNSFTSMVASRENNTLPTKWYNRGLTNKLGNNLFSIDGEFSSVPIYNLDGHPTYPLAILPQDMVLFTAPNPALVDGNNFVDIHENKYIYYSDSNARAWFIKIMSGISDLSLVDNGTGYELSWINPSGSSMAKVAVYARSDAFPEDENDSNAIMVYEDLAPIDGGVGSFIDTDAGRYGNIMHYAVLVFDDSIIDTNVTLVNKYSSKKITGSAIEDFAQPVFKRLVSTPSYLSTNEFRIAPYFKADLMMPLNESAADTNVIDLMGNYTGVASANTDTITVAGKTGNAMDFTANLVELTPFLKMEGDFSIQCWYKDLDDTNTAIKPLLGTTNNYNCLALVNSYGANVRLQQTLYYPQEANDSTFIPDMDFHFITFSKRSGEIQIFRDGQVMTGVSSISAIEKIFNALDSVTVIGRGYNTYSKQIIENFEKFDYAVSELQHRKAYNAGTGKVLDISDNVDGFAVIMTNTAQEHSVTCELNEKKNITNKNTINLEVYGSQSGTDIFSVIIKGAGMTISKSIDITVAKTWETQTINISGMSNDFKANITSISIQGGSAADLTIASIRNITAS